jgi:hypothetical protein
MLLRNGVVKFFRLKCHHYPPTLLAAEPTRREPGSLGFSAKTIETQAKYDFFGVKSATRLFAAMAGCLAEQSTHPDPTF